MRFHRFAAALAAALLLATPVATPARAQAPSAPTTSTGPASTDGAQPAAAQPSAASSTSSSGLPAEAAPPRTLRAYWHVWIAFTLAWLLLFGYVVSVGRRFGKLEREVEALGG